MNLSTQIIIIESINKFYSFGKSVANSDMIPRLYYCVLLMIILPFFYTIEGKNSIVTGDDDDDDTMPNTIPRICVEKCYNKNSMHSMASYSTKIIFIICDETEHQSQLFINSK